jgi:hypothetical protein
MLEICKSLISMRFSGFQRKALMRSADFAASSADAEILRLLLFKRFGENELHQTPYSFAIVSGLKSIIWVLLFSKHFLLMPIFACSALRKIVVSYSFLFHSFVFQALDFIEAIGNSLLFVLFSLPSESAFMLNQRLVLQSALHSIQYKRAV